MSARKLLKFFIPFPCGSLWNAHHAAWGPKSPDKIGLFGPLLPGENTYPHSCGPISDSPFVLLLIWACKLLRKLLPHTPPAPPRYSLLLHRATAKIGCGTRVHTAFWVWRLHLTKKFIRDVKKNLDRASLQFLKFKIIFPNNKVTALSESVK